MPGFNQRGPMNEGPMTGRGRGVCTGAVNPDQGFATTGYGMGMGRGRGGRGYQAMGGRGYGRWNTPAPAPDSAAIDPLQVKVDALETELAALKQQIKMMSEPKA